MSPYKYNSWVPANDSLPYVHFSNDAVLTFTCHMDVNSAMLRAAFDLVPSAAYRISIAETLIPIWNTSSIVHRLCGSIPPVVNLDITPPIGNFPDIRRVSSAPVAVSEKIMFNLVYGTAERAFMVGNLMLHAGAQTLINAGYPTSPNLSGQSNNMPFGVTNMSTFPVRVFMLLGLAASNITPGSMRMPSTFSTSDWKPSTLYGSGQGFMYSGEVPAGGKFRWWMEIAGGGDLGSNAAAYITLVQPVSAGWPVRST